MGLTTDPVACLIPGTGAFGHISGKGTAPNASGRLAGSRLAREPLRAYFREEHKGHSYFTHHHTFLLQIRQVRFIPEPSEAVLQGEAKGQGERFMPHARLI
eukprot:1400574-Pyramimonas_sp.AAC.1